MKFSFNLILNRDPNPFADALYEAGCSDATVGFANGEPVALFTRQSSSLSRAIRTAVDNVESVKGFRVIRVELDPAEARPTERPGRAAQAGGR
jgi:hypothetical protein